MPQDPPLPGRGPFCGVACSGAGGVFESAAVLSCVMAKEAATTVAARPMMTLRFMVGIFGFAPFGALTDTTTLRSGSCAEIENYCGFTTSHAQPARKHNPPIGVIAPSHRMFVTARM